MTRSASATAEAGWAAASSSTPSSTAANGPLPLGDQAIKDAFSSGAPGAAWIARAIEPAISPKPRKAILIDGLSAWPGFAGRTRC